ncbi:MAG: NAD-dependent epimerase/dehydratase family protein [bacterium]
MQQSESEHILITGGAGFIGSHLADALLKAGRRVTVIDDLSTGSLDNIRPLLGHERFHFARASVMDPIVLDRLTAEAGTVIHLAAAVGVQLIVERPVHTIETNIMGTHAVLQAALRYRRRVLLASTSEVYGKGYRIPFAEDDDVLLGSTKKNRWAYAASKMIDEFLGFAYHQEYDLEVVCFRLFNTVGPRQTGQYGMVIPRFINQALAGEPISVYGDGLQSRCFTDVRDVIRALQLLITLPSAPGQLYNIGGGEELNMLELAQRIKTLTGSASPIQLVPYTAAYGPGFEDMQRRVPDADKILRDAGWCTTYSLDATLRHILEQRRGNPGVKRDA